MKYCFSSQILILFFAFIFTGCALSQQSGLASISEKDLENHLRYLASEELEGRATGEPGLDLAAEYLATQARNAGLKAIDEDGDYFQEYTLANRSLDFKKSQMIIQDEDGSKRIADQKFYVLNANSDTLDISGDLVFAGYGITSEDDKYDDFKGIDLKDKIVIIMSRGPMDDEGKNILWNKDWKERYAWRYKIPDLEMREPKAVLIVPDPKSGNRSPRDMSRHLINDLSNYQYVEELEDQHPDWIPGVSTPFLFVHPDLVNYLLYSSGKTLEGLQKKIDRKVKSASFEIRNSQLSIHAEYKRDKKLIPNVVGMIEGSDPELKDEVIVYSAHFDHLGRRHNGEIYYGADDNASGTAALIELAGAFKKEQKNLKRSVVILWVSGEEIGLYGSEYYTSYPLHPLDQTLADINLDMIGTVKTSRDSGVIHGEVVSVMGMDSIQLIGGHQSSDLRAVHDSVTATMGIFTDTTKSSPDHPYEYYFRSDHFNFVQHDIPVLFYSTGNHVDYHKPSDNIDRINFEKLKKVTELSFLVGYRLVTMPERIIVNNPYSEW